MSMSSDSLLQVVAEAALRECNVFPNDPRYAERFRLMLAAVSRAADKQQRNRAASNAAPQQPQALVAHPQALAQQNATLPEASVTRKAAVAAPLVVDPADDAMQDEQKSDPQQLEPAVPVAIISPAVPLAAPSAPAAAASVFLPPVVLVTPAHCSEFRGGLCTKGAAPSNHPAVSAVLLDPAARAHCALVTTQVIADAVKRSGVTLDSSAPEDQSRRRALAMSVIVALQKQVINAAERKSLQWLHHSLTDQIIIAFDSTAVCSAFIARNQQLSVALVTHVNPPQVPVPSKPVAKSTGALDVSGEPVAAAAAASSIAESVAVQPSIASPPTPPRRTFHSSVTTPPAASSENATFPAAAAPAAAAVPATASAVAAASSSMSDVSSSRVSDSQCGTLQSLRLRNFMKHRNLVMDFSPHVNVVHERHAAGQSSILRAIEVVFDSLNHESSDSASLIQSGAAEAEVQVVLNNQGKGAFKHEQYGDSIRVSCQINRENGHSYQLFNHASNALVSREPREMRDMTEHFNIQVSKKFLQSTKPEDLFSFFLRTTRLEERRQVVLQSKAEMDEMRVDLQAHTDKISQLKQPLAIMRAEEAMSELASELTKRQEAVKTEMLQLKAHRDNLAKAITQTFNQLLTCAGGAGRLDFNMVEQTVTLVVSPGTSDAVSTVAFVLAVVQHVDAPFRVIDGLDESMDAASQQSAVKMILEIIKQDTQFLILSSLDISTFSECSNLKMHVLADDASAAAAATVPAIAAMIPAISASAETPSVAAAAAASSSSMSDVPVSFPPSWPTDRFLPFRFRTPLDDGLRLVNGVAIGNAEPINAITDDPQLISFRVVLTCERERFESAQSQMNRMLEHLRLRVGALSRHFLWICPVSAAVQTAPTHVCFVLEVNPQSDCTVVGLLSLFQRCGSRVHANAAMLPWSEWELLRLNSLARHQPGGSQRTPVCDQQFLLGGTNKRLLGQCGRRACALLHGPEAFNQLYATFGPSSEPPPRPSTSNAANRSSAASPAPASSAAGAAASSSAAASDVRLPFRFRTVLEDGLLLNDGVAHGQLQHISSATDDQQSIAWRLVLTAPAVAAGVAPLFRLAQLVNELDAAGAIPRRLIQWIAPLPPSNIHSTQFRLFVLQLTPSALVIRSILHAVRNLQLQHRWEAQPWIEFELMRLHREAKSAGVAIKCCSVPFRLGGDTADRPCRCNLGSHDVKTFNALYERFGPPKALEDEQHMDDTAAQAGASSSAVPQPAPVLPLHEEAPSRAPPRMFAQAFASSSAAAPPVASAAAANAVVDEGFIPFRFRTLLDCGLVLDHGVARSHVETIDSDTDDQATISFRVMLHARAPSGPLSADSLLQILQRHPVIYMKTVDWIAPLISTQTFPPAPPDTRAFVLQLRTSRLRPILKAARDALGDAVVRPYSEWLLWRANSIIKRQGLTSICNSLYKLGGEDQICCNHQPCKYSHDVVHVNKGIQLVLAEQEQQAAGLRSMQEDPSRRRDRSPPSRHSRSPVRSSEPHRNSSRDRDDLRGQPISRHASRSRSRERDRTRDRSRSPAPAAAAPNSASASGQHPYAAAFAMDHPSSAAASAGTPFSNLPGVSASFSPPIPIDAVHVLPGFVAGEVVTQQAPGPRFEGKVRDLHFSRSICVEMFQSPFQDEEGRLQLTIEQRRQDAEDWLAHLRSKASGPILDDSTPLLYVHRLGAEDRYELKFCFASEAAQRIAVHRIQQMD